MKKLSIAIAATFALLAATPGIAQAAPRDDASIPFVGFGVDTRGSDRFDNFSSIIVDGQRCPVVSVTKVAGPAAHKARRKTAG